MVASHIQYALRALLNKNLIRIVGEESNVRNRTRRVYKPSISKADYLVLVIRKYLDIFSDKEKQELSEKYWNIKEVIVMHNLSQKYSNALKRKVCHKICDQHCSTIKQQKNSIFL